MSRRRIVIHKEARKDARYASPAVARLISTVMRRGKVVGHLVTGRSCGAAPHRPHAAGSHGARIAPRTRRIARCRHE